MAGKRHNLCRNYLSSWLVQYSSVLNSTAVSRSSSVESKGLGIKIWLTSSHDLGVPARFTSFNCVTLEEIKGLLFVGVGDRERRVSEVSKEWRKDWVLVGGLDVLQAPCCAEETSERPSRRA
jgi:hypothetical protein